MRRSMFVLLLPVLFLTAARADEWTRKYTVAGAPELSVRAGDGNVDVRAGDVKDIEVRVTTRGWKIGPDEVRVIDRQTGDRVEIEVRIPNHHFGIGDRSVRVEVTTPRQTRLGVHTGDGNITFEGGRDDARLSTGDGNIQVGTFEGPLQARTGDGNIHARGLFTTLSLETGDGEIVADVQPGAKMTAPWRINTGDGNVKLRLPDNFAADLTIRTGDGRVTVDMPVTVSGSQSGHRMEGKLNGGGPALTIQTGDGNVRVEREGAAAAR